VPNDASDCPPSAGINQPAAGLRAHPVGVRCAENLDADDVGKHLAARRVERLLGDPRVPRRKKALLVALAGYLALPFDLVPDFIPVAGQLDDVVIVGLVLRSLIRGGGEPLVREYWPGPDTSLSLVLRLSA
jgi:uncharacterized membrane protein YkvA (DUF1232 family)